ncbi:hypothetical protein GCM10018777_52500 [Streptomyces albogriseolus]|nr:hypothetical protein GCM10010332_64060 [Streptomyces albogriseolus]GHG30369.1 hypothetical protein GCM10018777_52500 [Streptomyces viridodiastaticus]
MLAQAAIQSKTRPRSTAIRNSGTADSIPQHNTPEAAYSTRCVMTDPELGGGGAAPWPYMLLLDGCSRCVDSGGGSERIGPGRQPVP